MFCPDGELRLFCFDEKSSLNIRWRRQLGVPFAAYSVVCPWWLGASSYKNKMYFRWICVAGFSSKTSKGRTAEYGCERPPSRLWNSLAFFAALPMKIQGHWSVTCLTVLALHHIAFATLVLSRPLHERPLHWATLSTALISCIPVGIHGLLISSILGYRKQKDVRKGVHSQKIAKKGLGLIVDN